MGRKLKTTSENKNFNFTEEYIQKKLDRFFAEGTDILSWDVATELAKEYDIVTSE